MVYLVPPGIQSATKSECFFCASLVEKQKLVNRLREVLTFLNFLKSAFVMGSSKDTRPFITASDRCFNVATPSIFLKVKKNFDDEVNSEYIHRFKTTTRPILTLFLRV